MLHGAGVGSAANGVGAMSADYGYEEARPDAAEEPPHYHGHRERLRARFRDVGPEALADYELLEMILFRALPRRDVKPLAKDLMKRFGSFAEVVAASPARLAEVA